MSQVQGERPDSTASFVLSAFGDEIDDDLDVQLRLLTELGIGHLELRKAWGIRVLELGDSQVTKVKDSCDRYSVAVSCIGSPIGKSPIHGPLDVVLEDLERAFEIAEAVGTNRIRLFSFYTPEDDGDGQPERHIERAVSRLARLASLAERRAMLLLLENEAGLVGDTPERCQAILEGVDSPSLRFVWDTGNFPHAGVARAAELGWPLVGSYLAHVQVKDAMLSDRTITVAGQGDGRVPELLARLRDAGYLGFLALEPHLRHAGPRGGYSGPEGMRVAVAALRELMEGLGCQEGRGL